MAGPPHCYRCNKALPEDSRRLYSAWTKHHYCIDLDGCQRRYARRLVTDSAFRAEQESLRRERLERVNAGHERLAAAATKKRR